MILDAGGRPAQPETTAGRTVEIVRSFAYKLNLKNADGSPAYEDCQFFCSQKTACDAAMAEEVSRDLYEFCVDEVQDSIREFKERRARKSAQRNNAA